MPGFAKKVAYFKSKLDKSAFLCYYVSVMLRKLPLLLQKSTAFKAILFRNGTDIITVLYSNKEKHSLLASVFLMPSFLSFLVFLPYFLLL